VKFSSSSLRNALPYTAETADGTVFLFTEFWISRIVENNSRDIRIANQFGFGLYLLSLPEGRRFPQKTMAFDL
jgi:hypothetical protein